MKTLTILFSFLISFLYGQQLSSSVDVSTGNIWRGVILERSVVTSATVTLSNDHYEIGVAGTAGLVNSFGEQDFWVKGKIGNWYVQTFDYYYPSAGIPFSNFKNKNIGAHSPEVGIGYNNNVAKVYAGVFVYNDTTYSSYAEFKYAFTKKEYTVEPFIGATYGKTYMYSTTTNSVHVVNYGVSVSKTNLSYPVTFILLFNPIQDYSVVGLRVNLLQ